MSFERLLIWSSGSPPVWLSRTLKEGIMGNIQGSYMEFGPVVQKMSFKDISYLELWQPLVQRTHLCNFGRR